MPVFSYQGCDSTGSIETGTIEVNNEKLAFEILQSRGITVFEISLGEKSLIPALPWYKRDIKFRHANLSFQEQATTANLFATLFDAGLSAPEAIRIAALSSEKPEVARFFEKVNQHVADGMTFASAFETENRLFSPIFVSFLKISDAANTLPDLLKDLAKFFEKQSSARNKILSALIYPTVLLVAAVVMFLVVSLYLAPNLEPVFTSADKEVPATLSFLLKVNTALRHHGLIILAGAIISTISLIVLFQTPTISSKLGEIRFKLPIIGKMIKLNTLARLTQATELLISSGQPLASSLRTASQVMGGASEIGNRFREASEAIEAGIPASEVFRNDQNMPPTFKELFRIGEESNRLQSTLAALSETMSSQADRQAQRMLVLLTPILTLILGLGIGTLIYTLMDAILEVNELAF